MVDKTSGQPAQMAETRLQSFMKANAIKPSHLADDAGVSRQHLYHLRMGTAEPTRKVMVALATAARRILRRKVEVPEMFDLTEATGDPKIETVELVTIEHGLAFAEGWYNGDISDACDDTEIMTWPDDDAGMDQTEAQSRFHDLSDEICANVFALVKRQIAEAFVRAANQVLRRVQTTGQ
jgi:transcriptional regulator with XRE-family HTH domain